MTNVIVFDEPHPKRTRSIGGRDAVDKGTDTKQMMIRGARLMSLSDNNL